MEGWKWECESYRWRLKVESKRLVEVRRLTAGGRFRFFGKLKDRSGSLKVGRSAVEG